MNYRINEDLSEKEKNTQLAFLFLQLSPDVHDFKQSHKRYRFLAKYHHPDKGGNEEYFKMVNIAWDIVKKELKKR